jgi:hypothetical protein
VRQLLVVSAVQFLLIAPSSSARASATDSARTSHFSWRGHPLPKCSSFLISEFGVHYLLNPGPLGEREQLYFVTEDLGYMRNLNERSAVGGLIHLGANSDRAALGPAIRYRRWLSGTMAADLSVGADVIGLFNDENRYALDAPAPWVEAGVSAGDLLSLTVRGEHWKGLDRNPLTGSQSKTTWHMGAKLGSYLGPLGTLGTVVLLVALLSTVEN